MNLQSPSSDHRYVAQKMALMIGLIVSGALLLLFLLGIITVALTNELGLDSSRKKAAQSVESVVSGEKADFSLPENTSNIPDSLDEETLINVVAKNQPAVVRILTIYCADITLRSKGQSYSLPNSCAAGVGSGSFISSDGYLATNGHVAILPPQVALLNSLTLNTLDQLLQYLIKVNSISQVAARDIFNVAQSKRSVSEVVDVLSTYLSESTISTSNVDTVYAVQLSEEPLRLDRSGARYSVNFDDTIIQAKLIDSDYDSAANEAALKAGGQFTHSDVALLKAEGTFPYVKLGSINSVSRGDTLTAIGYPAFIDNSVQTVNWQTVPSITQGIVKEVAVDATFKGRKVILSTVPIAQGNSGGPAFNNEGEQVGINTYASLKCEDLQCFGDGTMRDVADLKALLVKNDITLKDGGVNESWHYALDAYADGNYTEALAGFREVQDEYPANYLVAPLARLAQDQIGSSTDASSTYQARNAIQVAFITVIIAAFISVVVLSILIIRYTRKHGRVRGV